MMLRWQISMQRLAACAIMATSASAFALASDNVSARPRVSGVSPRGRWESCGPPPERMVPMMTGMLGKPITLASAPLDVMTSELKLDAVQKKRINAILDKLEKDFKESSKSARNADPTATMSKMNDLLAQADKEIDAELTPAQKSLAEELLKKLTLLRTAGLPPDLYLELKLTAEQLKSLEDAVPDIKVQNKERTKEMTAAGTSGNVKKMQSLMSELLPAVASIVTKEQKSQVEKYRKKHPYMNVAMPMTGFGGL